MMTTRILAIAIAVSCAATLAAAAADAEPSTPRVGLYQLKNRSTFEGAENTRSPFWPIGHVQRQRSAGPIVSNAGPRPKFAPEMFNVSSIVLGHPSMAIINGRAYEEGEFLRAPRGQRTMAKDPRFRIRVARITDGQVTLQSEGESINVPLRRPELNERTATDESELLLQDR